MKKKWEEAKRLLQKSMDALSELKGQETTEKYKSALEAVREATEDCNEAKVRYYAERASAEGAPEEDELNKKAKKFSLVKFITECKSGDLTGVEKDMHELAVREAKENGITLKGFGIPSMLLRGAFGGQNVTTPADGGHLAGSTKTYQEALRAKLVLAQAGAQYLTGLVGDIEIIDGEAISAGWLAENADGGDTKKAFSKRTFGPKRNFVNVPISLQLLAQSSEDIERMIWDDILNAHAQLIEEAAINGSGASGQPTGLLNTSGIGTVAVGTNGGPLTWKQVVDLETQISLNHADVDGLSYVTNAKVRGVAKQTLKSAGVAGYIWEKDEMNGYKSHCSNLVPSNLTKGTASTKCSAVVFGNFKDLLIGSWGGLDIIVDPYTAKKQGAVELTLNGYNNVIVKRPKSFAAVKDITTD